MALTGFSKALVVGGFVAACVFGYKQADKRGMIPHGKQTQDIAPGAFANSTGSVPVTASENYATASAPETGGAAATQHASSGSLGRPLRVGVVTWGGYAGGEWFNRGFKPNPDSLFTKRYGMDVEFVLLDDYNLSRDAWKSDKVDLLWSTADSFVTESKGLSSFNPKVVFQADWSRGGDAIVAKREIKTVADLKGKRVSVAFGTPSHTFLLWLLSAGGLNYKDIEVVEAPSAINSAEFFRVGKVDAAVVWSPDDTACVDAVQGAHVLQSTKSASNIIADVFYAKQEFLEAHPQEVKNLLKGWFEGAADLNASDAHKHAVAKILAVGQGTPEKDCYLSVNKVRLCTYGDNVNFFNLNGSYAGVKGEELYTKMQVLYNKLNLSDNGTPAWRQVVDTSFLRQLDMAGSQGQAAEGKATFAAISSTQAEELGAVATKRATVNFASGSATLDDSAKSIIDSEFADIARTFGRSRILISGNTDSTGSASLNENLSRQRAQSVASYLSSAYRFDSRRFTIVGNGANKPVADNTTSEGREQNRRTDFELLNAQ